MKTQKNRSKLSIRSDSDRIESLFDFRDDVLSARLHHKNHTPYCFLAFFVLFYAVLYYTLLYTLCGLQKSLPRGSYIICASVCLSSPGRHPAGYSENELSLQLSKRATQRATQKSISGVLC